MTSLRFASLLVDGMYSLPQLASRAVRRVGCWPSTYALCRAFSSLEETLTVTKSCAQRIKELRLAGKNDALKLRITVDGGGCSGFKYHFVTETTEVAETDIIYERDGEKVVIDSGSMEFVKGATVDFTQDLIKASFAIVNNPISESACGCGSSFAIKQFAKNPAID